MELKVMNTEKVQTVEPIYTQDILGNEFRVYGDLENPIFLAKEVADWIDYSFKDKDKGTRNVNMMLQTVDEEEKLMARLFTSGQKREMWFLTEDGLYEVLMQSRKPIAKQFKKQVKKILKQIRHTGGYIPHDPEEDDATIMAKALLISQKTIEKKNAELKLAEEENLKLSRVIDGYKPKIEYVDEILNCYDALLITNIAFDYGLSAKALNKILCEERVQRNVRGQYILYAEHLGKGYTRTETRIIKSKPRIHTLWTQKGRLLIHEVLKKRNIMPLRDIEGKDNITQLFFG